MRGDEANNKEERWILGPKMEWKGRQDGDYKKTRMRIPGLY
jgi:hypothetical protein